MNILDRLRAAWRSFVSSFDYEPPRAMAPTEAAETQGMTEPMQAHAGEGSQMQPQMRAPATAAFDDATRLELARIATAQAHELPTYVTKQARHDDGTPILGADGKPILLHQDGRPLGVIELAVMARQAELRRQAGG